MDNIVTGVKLASAALVSFLTAAFGGWDAWLMALIAFTVMDFLLGVVKAVVNKTVSSAVMFKGGIKKILIYVVVAVAVILDGIVVPEGGALFRTLAIGYYIATEGLSVLENIAAMGVPLPQKLIEVLQQLREKNGGGQSDDAGN